MDSELMFSVQRPGIVQMANNTDGCNTFVSAGEGELEKQALIKPPRYNRAAIEERKQNRSIDNQENNFQYADDEQASRPKE